MKLCYKFGNQKFKLYDDIAVRQEEEVAAEAAAAAGGIDLATAQVEKAVISLVLDLDISAIGAPKTRPKRTEITRGWLQDAFRALVRESSELKSRLFGRNGRLRG